MGRRWGRAAGAEVGRCRRRAEPAAGVLQGARGGVSLPERDVDRVRSHLAKYYAKLDETAPWDRSD